MIRNKLTAFDTETKFNMSNDVFHDHPVLLFIEPYGSSIVLLEHALRKNYNIIVLTANKDLRIVPNRIIDAVHLAVQIDTADENKVLELIKQLMQQIKIHAVIPGFEYFVPLAAKVNEILGLAGIPVHQVMKMRNKYLMRESLNEAGIKTPAYFLVNTISQLDIVMKKMGFPAVCKPIDAAGSVNVKKVNDEAEAISAAIRILKGKDVLWGHALSNSLLFEEYVAGKEYSVEGVVNNNEVKFFSITEKFVSDESDFIEVGHIVNPPLDEDVKNHILAYVKQVIFALKPNFCPFHAEIRLPKNGGPVLMEIAARLAGDRIADLINLTCDQNYFDEILAAYLGQAATVHEITQNSIAGIRFFYRPQTAFFSCVTGQDEVRKLSVEDISIYYPPHQPIPAFPKPLRRLGHVIIKNNHYDNLVNDLKRADGMMVFHA